MGRAASGGLTLVLFAAFVAAVVVAVAAKTQGDGLVRVPQFDYTNDFDERGYSIASRFRANREDLRPEGGDVVVGDRLVRDCKVVER